MPIPSCRVLGTALLAVLGALPAAGQHRHAAMPDTLRLQHVLALLADTPTLEASRLERDVVAAEAEAADAWPDPTVGLSVQPFPLYTARGAQRTQFRAEQMMPWPGTLSRRRALAETAIGIAAARTDVLAADLALEAQEAFIALARAQSLASILEQYRARLDAFSEAAAVRYEVGRGPQAAILRVQLEGGRLDARLLSLDAERHLAVTTLARLLDRPDLAEGPVLLEPIVLPRTDSALVAMSLRLRPETAVLDATVRQNEAEEALADIARYPEIGVNATYFDIADTSIPMTADGRDALMVGVTVRVPLDRASRRARIEAAQIRGQQIEAQQQALVTAIETHVRGHLIHAHHEFDALHLYRTRLVPQAETTVESTLSAYTTGQADFLTLLDAERARFELRIAEAEAESRFLIAAARLARAVGVVSLYDLPGLTDE